MSTLAELKQRLEAARVERERREEETREQEEQELQRLAEEERREECACREQQRAGEEEKRAEQERVAEGVREQAEEEQVAEGQRNTTGAGGEGSKETETMAGVTEATGESWETDIARLHAATMAGGSKDGEEEYRATGDTCWNCRHRKLVCERPE